MLSDPRQEPTVAKIATLRDGLHLCALRGPQGLFEIGEKIIDVLNSYGEAHVSWFDTGGKLLVYRQLRMSCRRRMDCEAARVADIGDMVEKLQGIDKPPARFKTTLQFEYDQPAVPATKIRIGAAPLFARVQRRIYNPFDRRNSGKKARDGTCILTESLHSKRQCFDSLQDQEGVERTSAGPRSRSKVTRALRM